MNEITIAMNYTAEGVSTNVDSLIAHVRPQLDSYKYEVTVLNTKQAKRDAAALRSFVTSTSRQRSMIRKKLLESWEGDDKRLLQLEKEIKAIADSLAGQAKVFEDQEKEKQKEQLEFKWNAICDERYPFHLAFNPKWLNKTAKADAVHAEMKEIHARLEEDWSRVKAGISDSALLEPVFEAFCKEGDANAARMKLHELMSFQATLGKPEEKKEEEKREAEETEDVPFFESALPDQSLFLPSEWAQQPVIHDVWQVAGTKDQLHALWQIAMEMGIQVRLAQD